MYSDKMLMVLCRWFRRTRRDRSHSSHRKGIHILASCFHPQSDSRNFTLRLHLSLRSNCNRITTQLWSYHSTTAYRGWGRRQDSAHRRKSSNPGELWDSPKLQKDREAVRDWALALCRGSHSSAKSYRAIFDPDFIKA